jgi:DNA-binding NtrC family response regulator
MNKRILVIEPSRTIRVLLDITLRNAGHHVAAFADTAAAFAFLSQGQVHREPPDMAFVALHSSAKESYKVIATLIRRYPHLLMIVILQPEEGQTAQQRIQAIGAMYLMRPFTVQDILACTTSVYERAEKRNASYEHA